MPVSDLMAPQNLSAKDMPYVMFESRVEQDKSRPKDEGIVWKDQPYAKITPPGSKDEHFEKIPQWWDKLESEVRAGRLLPEWVTQWKSRFAEWQKGNELPVEGTPIKGWPMISPAQQKMLIDRNVLTVESLAYLTDEGMANVGMGALELKRRAESWLIEKECLGGGAAKLSSLQRENDILKETIANLTEKVDALSRSVEAKQKKGA